MKLITITIAALASLFGVTVIWITALGPFNSVIDTFETSLGGMVSGDASTAISNIADYFGIAMTLFIVLTAVAVIAWWIMKIQEREVVTERYLY